MGSIFCKCFTAKRCKYCGISENHFASNNHRNRPSCRCSPNKPLIQEDFMYFNNSHSYPGLNNKNIRRTSNGYHKFE